MNEWPVNLSESTEELMRLVRRLYPLHRSMTGEGLRDSLRVLSEHVPLEIHETPSGTTAFDWKIPDEWSIRDAFFRDSQGRRWADFRQCHLHVVAYSRPMRARMTWRQLRERVHTIPNRPDWVPYRTAYFQDDWGFCLSHRDYARLDLEPDAEFDVVIDSALQPGRLNYAECWLPGESREEVLVSAHVCHPAQCNDNLSGVAVAAFWARRLMHRRRRLSYRFLFAPATIGALAWLSSHQHCLRHVKHGLVLTLLGDGGPLTYKRSWFGSSDVDRAVEHVLRCDSRQSEVRPFQPWGYDERQFNSPGIRLPVGCLMRTPPGEFPEYHSSADNLQFIKGEALIDALRQCLRISEVLEHNDVYVNCRPCGEPRLAPHGLYGPTATQADVALRQAVLWNLNLGDGEHSLLRVAERSGLPFARVHQAAEWLHQRGLLEPTSRDASAWSKDSETSCSDHESSRVGTTHAAAPSDFWHVSGPSSKDAN